MGIRVLGKVSIVRVPLVAFFRFQFFTKYKENEFIIVEKLGYLIVVVSKIV